MTTEPKQKIAIIGAGLAGLNCARLLKDSHFEITIIDKGRYPGGRLASRTRDENQFDYGAQYFTIRDPRFCEFIEPFITEGKVKLWDAVFAKYAANQFHSEKTEKKRYVASPAMRSLSELVTSGAKQLLSHRVTDVSYQSGKWVLAGESEGSKSFKLSGFDHLVLNMPPVQANELFPNSKVVDIKMAPCIALGVSFQERLGLKQDAILVEGREISFTARDSSKPDRPEGERWMIHASPEWSRRNYEIDSAQLESHLIELFAQTFAIELPGISYTKLHKWRYALPENPTRDGFIIDEAKNVAYCGDWLFDSRVEGAFVSGHLLAEHFLEKHQGSG